MREEIVAHSQQFQPYSEFNYVNMYAWDLRGSTRVTLLHDNLVLHMPDYMDGPDFYSFLGNNRVVDTTDILLNEAEALTDHRYLRLVPEVGALLLNATTKYDVTEEHDGHDYIISLPEVAAKYGPRYRNMRHEIYKFLGVHEHQTQFVELNPHDPHTQGEMIQVFLGREYQKTENNHANELLAIERLFDATPIFKVEARGLRIDDQLRAFIIYEKLAGGWSIGHFWKADISYRGIYRYLMNNVAQQLTTEGFHFMNIEQDLGIPGLKYLKNLLRPVDHLKKFAVTDRA